MDNDTNQIETIHGSGDVATLLKVKESTLRKYTLMLEEAGYHFDKNDFGQRAFYDRDVIALKKLIEIKKHPDMTLKQACNAVVTWVKQNSMSDSAINDIAPLNQYEDRYISEIEELKDEIEEMKEVVSQQTEFIKELSKQLDQQNERQEQRDRALMESLRGTLEMRKQLVQIAATQEEQKKQIEEEKKKGFLARMFGK